MFGKRFAVDAINRSAESESDRRRFLKAAGITGMGLVGATAFAPSASASPLGLVDDLLGQDDEEGSGQGPSDAAILNFALNLEYLEAEFYVRAVTGEGLPNRLTGGQGERGRVRGGRAVDFQTKAIKQYAEEIASDEKGHVEFLRTALGGQAVAEPAINLDEAFTAAARAAGLIGRNQQFDPYANEVNFLLAAYVFEDVGVTAYKGAAPLIDNKTFLEAAAGILAAEGYHAGNIRSALYALGLQAPKSGVIQATEKISDARDSLDAPSDKDQGVEGGNIVPTDEFGVCFSRTPGDVLNIVYLTKEAATEGGFFPNGVNGPINTSSAFGS